MAVQVVQKNWGKGMTGNGVLFLFGDNKNILNWTMVRRTQVCDCMKHDLFLLYVVGVLPICMSVHHIHDLCPKRLEEGVRFFETEVTESCKLPCGAGNSTQLL